MVRLGPENRVGLCPRKVGEAGDFRDAPHVVARVEVEWLKHLVCGDGHLGKELNAVGAATLVQCHDAIEEAVGPFTWGELRNVGSARHWLVGGHPAELGLREGVERTE